MATGNVDRSGSFLRRTEEDLTCPVCYEIFIDPWIPKILQGCSHVVCLVCLTAMPNGFEPGTKICPECRAVTRIPRDGVKGLKTNLRVQNLAETFYKYNVKRSGNLYDICEKHDTHLKSFVCTRCRKVICSICFQEDHITHKVKTMENFKRSQAKHDEELSRKLNTKLTDLSEYSDKLFRMEETIQRALQIERVKIRKHVESIIAAVKEREEEMITDLHEITKAENLTPLRDERRRVSTLIDKIKTLQDKSDNSEMDKLSDEDIGMQEFRRANKKSLVNESACVQVPIALDVNIGQFQSKQFDRDIGEFKKIGQFQFVENFGVFKDSRSLALTTTGSIVILDRDISAACFHVYEYSRRDNEYVWKDTFKLDKYGSSRDNPVDLAIAKMDKYLVAYGSGVDVFSSIGQHKEPFKLNAKVALQTRRYTFSESLQSPLQSLGMRGTRPKHASRAHCLAVTNNSKIIVGSIAESVITIYNLDQTVFKDSFKIPIENFHPIKLATKGDQLAMIDIDNNMLCAMDLNDGELSFQVNVVEPQGLCYSADTILVAIGTKEGVVEQFCSQSGLWLGQVVRGLPYPVDMITISDDRVIVLCKDKANLFGVNRV